MNGEAIYQDTSTILKLYRPALSNIIRHYDKHKYITDELTNLMEGVILSGDCKLGLELLMCLDEFWGGYSEPGVALLADNLRGAENGSVRWIGESW